LLGLDPFKGMIYSQLLFLDTRRWPDGGNFGSIDFPFV